MEVVKSDTDTETYFNETTETETDEVTVSSAAINGDLTLKREVVPQAYRNETERCNLHPNHPVSVILDSGFLEEIVFFDLKVEERIKVIKLLCSSLNEENKKILLNDLTPKSI